MPPIDEALVFEAIRYQAAYRAEARQNHHRSIPGPLVVEMVNAWEAANELLAGGIWLDTPDDLPADFFTALAGVEAREARKQQELVAYWEKRFPTLMNSIP